MASRIFNYLEKVLRTDVRYVVKGGAWFGFSQVFSGLLALASATAFANLLSKETYGLYRYLLSILAILTVASLSRMDDSFSRSVARGFEGDYWRSLKIRIKWGIFGTLAGFIIALYYYLNANTALAFLTILVGVFVPFFDSPLIYNGFLIGRKNFKAVSIISNISSFIYTGLIILTVFLTKNIFLIVTGYLLITIFLRLGALFYIYKKYKPNKQREEATLNYGKKLSFLDMANTFAASFDNILVFNHLSPTDLAVYSFAKKIPEQIKLIPKNLTSLSTPKFSVKDISDPYVKKETARKSLFLFLFLAAVALVYIVLAPFIFKIFFGPYKDYVFLSQIYALSFPLNFGGLFLNFLEMARQEKAVVKLNILAPIIRVGVIFLSLKFYGLFGLVIGFSVIRFSQTILRFYFFQKAR